MIKKNNLLLLVPLILFIIIILFFYNYNKKTDNKDNVITEKNTEKVDGFVKLPEKSEDINILNKAVFSSTKIEDTKNCNSIENKDLKENCISQIKFKFSDINKAKSIKDCEKIKNQKDADVCFLNLKSNNITDYLKACEKIKNKDIKESCISQNKFKFSDINKAQSIKDCEKIKNQKDADVCFLNLRNKNITDYSKACEKIINKDIKDLCLLKK